MKILNLAVYKLKYVFPWILNLTQGGVDIRPLFKLKITLKFSGF